MVVPIEEVDDIEYFGVEVVVGLQLRDRADVDWAKGVDMFFDYL